MTVADMAARDEHAIGTQLEGHPAEALQDRSDTDDDRSLSGQGPSERGGEGVSDQKFEPNIVAF
ncbi:MAG TPA: hypothetical protein VJ489_03805, partial [Thermoplasmata archaeon]|nr:hypothetical protein [Thermoplasmata archaeon]